MTESPASHPDFQCPVCGRSRSQKKWTVLRECQECHFISFRDASSEDLAKLYDRDYFHGQEYTDYLGQEFALRKSMRRHLDQMQRFQSLKGPLLEVGCAYGFFLEEARRRIEPVCGIDVAEDAVKHARETFNLEAHYGDFLSFDFGAQRFRTICFWDTIEHLAQPDRFAQRAFELLEPGGIIYITTGDISAFNARIRGRHWRQIHPPTHVSYFSRSTMKRLLEKCGFEVMPIETATYFHTLKHILGALAMRPGLAGKIAKPLESMIGGSVGKWGFWLNLGDTMFAAARRPKD